MTIFTRTLTALAVCALFAFTSADAQAQSSKPASPRGSAETQIDGKWITVDYGRPILRGRRGIFGADAEYGTAVLAGAPVWRLGANQSTRLNTEVDMHFGDKKVPAGEYSLFAELAASGWTLIVSSHAAKDNYGDAGDGLWGAYGYTPDKDVARIPMTVSTFEFSIDEFTIGFTDVTTSGGTLNVWWDNTGAAAPFTVGSM